MNGSMVRQRDRDRRARRAVLLERASQASAQSFISPFIGYDFGGDSGCPEITDCEDKTRNLGVSFGSVGNVFGGELEFAYIDNFFGETPGISSNVLTLMGNFMLAPKFGIGAAVRRGRPWSDQDATPRSPSADCSTDNNDFGWDIGGGHHRLFRRSLRRARRHPVLPCVPGSGHPRTAHLGGESSTLAASSAAPCSSSERHCSVSSPRRSTGQRIVPDRMPERVPDEHPIDIRLKQWQQRSQSGCLVTSLVACAATTMRRIDVDQDRDVRSEVNRVVIAHCTVFDARAGSDDVRSSQWRVR